MQGINSSSYLKQGGETLESGYFFFSLIKIQNIFAMSSLYVLEAAFQL